MTTRPTRPERPLPGKVTTPLPREPGAPTPILDYAIPPLASDGAAPAPRHGATEPQPQDLDPLIGVDVGDGYVIASRLAAGGMGALYIAQHRAASTKRKAIKVLLGDLLAKCSPRTREDIAHRFEVEARIALNLDHPNVINVDGWGTLPNGAIYIKMELLKGKDLRRWARDRHDGRVPVDEVLQVFAQVCSALEQAHRLGVVHRDLKPENVFMVEHPEGAIATKLLDFGIARVISPDALPGGKKTTIPRAMGTPGYWSPEQQTSPGDVDHRADLYALGVIAYELLTGHLPGFGSLAPHMLPPGFPVEWYEPIAKALAGDPTKRHASVRDFLAELIASTPDGATLAASACPTLFRTAASAADSTIKAPAASVPGMRHSAPPPPAPPLPPSTLAHAAGAYGTQTTRRGRAALAIGGAFFAAAIVVAVVVATRPGSSSTRAANSPAATPPRSSPPAPSSLPAPSSADTAPSSADTAPAPPAAGQAPGPSSTAAPDAGPTTDAATDAAPPTAPAPTTTRPTPPTSSPPPRRSPPRRTGIERLGP